MRKTRRSRRLSKTMRLGVYTLTLIFLCATPISFWPKPGLEIERVAVANSNQGRTRTMVYLYDGVLMVHYAPGYQQMYFGGIPPVGWHIDWTIGTQPWPPIVSEWNAFPTLIQAGGSGGTYHRREIPLIPVAFLLLCTSIAMHIWVRINRPKDGCKNCGYSLTDLPTETCPECGGTTYESSCRIDA